MKLNKPFSKEDKDSKDFIEEQAQRLFNKWNLLKENECEEKARVEFNNFFTIQGIYTDFLDKNYVFSLNEAKRLTSLIESAVDITKLSKFEMIFYMQRQVAFDKFIGNEIGLLVAKAFGWEVN